MKKNKFVTHMTECKMHELLYLCTKNVCFMFSDKIYIQINGVVMDSVSANVFTIDLEIALISNFCCKLSFWRCFVDDFYLLCEEALQQTFSRHTDQFSRKYKDHP